MKKYVWLLIAILQVIYITSQNDIERMINDQIRNIPIPSYERKRGMDICGLNTELSKKRIDTTVVQLEAQLGELLPQERQVLMGVVWASKVTYSTFTFEVKSAVSGYSLLYSQFVGVAKKDGGNVSVYYYRSKVTGYLFYLLGLQSYCGDWRPANCPACINKVSLYCKYGETTTIYFPPYDEPQQMKCPYDPQPDELVYIATYLKEYSKNELIKAS